MARRSYILNCTFTNNTADANGGAVYWYGTNGTISGSNFTDNRALGIVNGTYGRSGEGGAVVWTGSNGLVDDCNFVNNTAAKNGGAVYLDNIKQGECDNTTFSNSRFENVIILHLVILALKITLQVLMVVLLIGMKVLLMVQLLILHL